MSGSGGSSSGRGTVVLSKWPGFESQFRLRIFLDKFFLKKSLKLTQLPRFTNKYSFECASNGEKEMLYGN